VINCVGLVPQRKERAVDVIRTNALFPHLLQEICAPLCRLIHISTDCVFSGAGGLHARGYREQDQPDPIDLYGQTKLLGEVTDEMTLTLRTSMIGRELIRRTGLLEWFLGRVGPVRGFANVRFSGVTTVELASIIRQIILEHPMLRGLYHVAGPPISKYALLRLCRSHFDRPVELAPVGEPESYRVLDDTAFRTVTRIPCRSWEEMLARVI